MTDSTETPKDEIRVDEMVLRMQHTASELEQRRRGNQLNAPQGEQIAEVDSESLAAIKLRIEKAKADRKEQSNGLRKSVAQWVLIFVGVQLFIANALISTYFGVMLYRGNQIPSEVIIAWLSSTIVEIIGLLWVIARSLFPFRDHHRDRDAEKPNKTSV